MMSVLLVYSIFSEALMNIYVLSMYLTVIKTIYTLNFY